MIKLNSNCNNGNHEIKTLWKCQPERDIYNETYPSKYFISSVIKNIFQYSSHMAHANLKCINLLLSANRLH